MMLGNVAYLGSLSLRSAEITAGRLTDMSSKPARHNVGSYSEIDSWVDISMMNRTV